MFNRISHARITRKVNDSIVYGNWLACTKMRFRVALPVGLVSVFREPQPWRESCGFRGAMDTSGYRIPGVSGVLVYPPQRLVYQILCRPHHPTAMKSVVRQGFGSPAHGVSAAG